MSKEIAEKKELTEKQASYNRDRKQDSRITALEHELAFVKKFIKFVYEKEMARGIDDSDCFVWRKTNLNLYIRAVILEGDVDDNYVLFDVETKSFPEKVRKDLVFTIENLGDYITDGVAFCKKKGVPNIYDGYSKVSDLATRNNLKRLKDIEYTDDFEKDDFESIFRMYVKRITTQDEISRSVIGHLDEIDEPSRTGNPMRRLMPVGERKLHKRDK